MPSAAAVPYGVQIRADDYLAARRLDLRPRRGLRLALWGLGPPLLLVLAVDFHLGGGRGGSHPFLPSVLGAGVFLLLWYYVLLPHQVRRAYQSASDPAAASVNGEVSTDGITVRAGGLQGRLAWPDVARWKQDASLILLYSAAGEFTMIPLRGFATEADRAAALELIARHAGPPLA